MLSLHFVHARLMLFLLRAIDLQINAVENLHGNSLWSRTLEGRKDADMVLKVFQSISSLCNVFQVRFLDHGQGCLCSMYIDHLRVAKINTQLPVLASQPQPQLNTTTTTTTCHSTLRNDNGSIDSLSSSSRQHISSCWYDNGLG
jgi:hypothetical protein